MKTLREFFDQIVLINRASRTDRLAHARAQSIIGGFAFDRIFVAHEGTQLDGTFNGNFGCVASHRGVLELICHHGWQRTLILEDDFEIVRPGYESDHCKNRLPFEAQWAKMEPEIPPDWDMLYLGGHYAAPAKERTSEHVIRCGRMFTTSSYAVTHAFARRICPHIQGAGPIDSLLGYWHDLPDVKAYIFTPRLMVQYENTSDLQHRVMNNARCMLDPNHEAAMPWPAISK